MLQTATQEVQQVLQTDRVMIYQNKPRSVGTILAESFFSEEVQVQVQAQSSLLRQFQALCRQLKRSKSLSQTETFNFNLDPSCHQEFQIRAEVIIPVVVQNTLWGLLIVHQCRFDRQWQAWELNLLNQLAIHLESLIQQAELYREVQRLNTDLERQIQARTAELQLAFEFEATLKRVTDKVRDSLDEHQILETVVAELAKATGANGCNAALYNLEAGTSTIHYEYTNDLSPYQGRIVSLEAFPEIYNQLFEGHAFQFCSLIPNPVRGRAAMLTCPIVDDQGVLGDLWLINQAFCRYTEQDIRLVQQVANQCAIAIRQARLFQAAQAQVKELERLNRLKDDFLSTVSHELRTPMANMKMAIQMLAVALKQAGVLEAQEQRIAQYFKILTNECQRETSLINDLLDLSRLDSESQILKMTPVDLTSWLPAITHSFVERAQEQQQHLKVHAATPLPTIVTDLSYLERILIELLQNACKYTPAEETITIAATALPPEKASEPSILLTVSNTGVQLPASELSRIFEKFYRIPNNDPWQHGGTGLGLALVKKLVEHLRGTIWAESDSQETRFCIILPTYAIAQD